MDEKVPCVLIAVLNMACLSMARFQDEFLGDRF
jgi:hypothetical protein